MAIPEATAEGILESVDLVLADEGMTLDEREECLLAIKTGIKDRISRVWLLKHPDSPGRSIPPSELIELGYLPRDFGK